MSDPDELIFPQRVVRRVGRVYSDEEIAAKGVELAALRRQVEELTAERDELEGRALALFWLAPDNATAAEAQDLEARAARMQANEKRALAAEQQVKDLREALIEARKWLDGESALTRAELWIEIDAALSMEGPDRG